MSRTDELRALAAKSMTEDDYRALSVADIATVFCDYKRLLAENARLEAERDAEKETIRKVEDRLKTILGATEYVKPGTGIYMTTKLALECIKERRGPQPATGAEEPHEE